MKTKLLTTLIMSSLLFGCAVSSTQNSIESKLYGTWDCEVVDNFGGMKTSMFFQVVYHRNGKANSFGNLTIDFGNSKTLDYFLATTSSWSVKDNFLIEETNDTKVKPLNDVPKGSLFDLESLIPENVTEASRIVEVNGEILKVVPESTKTPITCQKV